VCNAGEERRAYFLGLPVGRNPPPDFAVYCMCGRSCCWVELVVSGSIRAGGTALACRGGGTIHAAGNMGTRFWRWCGFHCRRRGRRFLLVSNKGLQDDRTVVVAAAAFRPGEGAKDSVFEV
jgi:hypothetical protein